MSTRAAGIGLAFATATISGFAVFVNAYGVKRFDDATVYTTAKNAVAGLLLLGLFLALRPRSGEQATWKVATPRRRAAVLAVAVVGGSIPFVLFFEGLSRATATQAAFIHKTLVVWVALLAVPLLRERLGPIHYAAIGLLLAGQAAIAGGAGTITFGAGEAMILAATLLWAVEVVLVKQLLGSFASPLLAVGRMALGAVLLIAYLAVSGRLDDFLALGAEQWQWALLTGVLLAGYVGTWYAALARAQAVDVTAVLVFGAVVTAVLDRGVHDVPLDLAGLALIAVGTALVAAWSLRRPRPSTA